MVESFVKNASRLTTNHHSKIKVVSTAFEVAVKVGPVGIFFFFSCIVNAEEVGKGDCTVKHFVLGYSCCVRFMAVLVCLFTVFWILLTLGMCCLVSSCPFHQFLPFGIFVFLLCVLVLPPLRF